MKYIPPIGGAENDPYVDVNEAAGVDGSYVPAAAIEGPQRELHNLIVGLGGTPDPEDYGQLFDWLIASLAMKVGDASQNFRVATAVAASDATPLAQVQSLTTVASTAEAQALSENTKMLTPLRLMEALQGANQSLAANGYQKLPGNWIVQWGSALKPTTSSPLSIIFPITFPTVCFIVLPTLLGASNKTVPVSGALFSTAGFSAYLSTGDANTSIGYLAFGL